MGTLNSIRSEVRTKGGSLGATYWQTDRHSSLLLRSSSRVRRLNRHRHGISKRSGWSRPSSTLYCSQAQNERKTTTTQEIIHGHTIWSKSLIVSLSLEAFQSNPESTRRSFDLQNCQIPIETRPRSDLRGDSIGQLSYRTREWILRISNLISDKSKSALVLNHLRQAGKSCNLGRYLSSKKIA